MTVMRKRRSCLEKEVAGRARGLGQLARVRMDVEVTLQGHVVSFGDSTCIERVEGWTRWKFS